MTSQTSIVSAEVVDQAGGYSLREVCERSDCHAEFVIKLVSYGVIAPMDESVERREWLFGVRALERLQRAQRLQRDLDINVPGLAMALDLLDEVQSLRREMDQLHRRLGQLVED